MKKEVDISEMIPLIKESLNQGKDVKFKPFGNSMFPTIVGGVDSVVLSFPNKLKPMDICLYRRKDNTFVLHRLVKISGETCSMLGDNQYYLEKGVLLEDIIGVVTQYKHEGKIIFPSKKTYRIKYRIRTNFRLLINTIVRIKRKIKKD